MEEVLKIIKLLKSKKPLSIIRYGDGEGKILTGYCDQTTMNMLGRILTPTEKIDVKQNLIEALKDADIVGLPTIKHINHTSPAWREAQATFDRYVIAKDKCSCDIHYDLLPFYNEILKEYDHILYIGSINVNFKNKYVTRIPIAPEHWNSITYTGKQHYPDQFNDIRRWIKSLKLNNTLCLVGAGYIGKIYLKWCKEQGGTAFDIGSCMEQLAGFRIRGKNKGVDNTYKL